MYEKGEFQCKKHVQAIQNHGSDSICTVCRCTHTFCILGECWKLCISLSSCIVFTIIIIAMYMNHCHPSIAHIHTTQPFQHVLSFPGSPSHSPTYWFTGKQQDGSPLIWASVSLVTSSKPWPTALRPNLGLDMDQLVRPLKYLEIHPSWERLFLST